MIFIHCFLCPLFLWLFVCPVFAPAEPHYRCGEDGVQLKVPRDYLGPEISFQVRDEFGTGYPLTGCLSTCLLITRANGTSIFYSPYSVCLSTRKHGIWRLRIRLIGITTKDIVLICPKPKNKTDRVITRPTTTTLHSTTANKTSDPVDANVSCVVPVGRISCMDSGLLNISHNACLLSGCCYDPKDAVTPCFYGHTVSVKCSREDFFQLVISRQIVTPPILLNSVVLVHSQCNTLKTLKGQFLEITGNLSDCSTRTFQQGHLLYEMSLTAFQEIIFSPLEAINQDTAIKVKLPCLFPSNVSISLVITPVNANSVIDQAELSIELSISKGHTFASFFSPQDYPLQILLGNPVYIEVNLLYPSDPRLHLQLHQCWGSMTPDPASPLTWPLLEDGCPFYGDDSMTQVIPVSYPSPYQRFVVPAFTFLGQQSNTQVYFLCSVSICQADSDTCLSDCSSGSRRKRRSTEDMLHLVSSHGPVIIQ